MAQYRKKPVVIEAVRWNGQYTSPGEWPDWFNEAIRKDVMFVGVGGLTIGTLEGDLHATSGDMIIKGVKGELYPCKPDIFEALYDQV